MIGKKYIIETGVSYSENRSYRIVEIVKENKSTWKLSNGDLLYKDRLSIRGQGFEMGRIYDVYEYTEEKWKKIKEKRKYLKMERVKRDLIQNSISLEDIKEYIEYVGTEKLDV